MHLLKYGLVWVGLGGALLSGCAGATTPTLPAVPSATVATPATPPVQGDPSATAALAASAIALEATAAATPEDSATASPEPTAPDPTVLPTEPSAPTALPTEPSAPTETPALAPTLPPPAPELDLATVTLTLVPIVENLRQPVYVTHANDNSGRLFVVERAGTIRVVQDRTLGQAAFLDITSRVGSGSSEQGLLGLAFHPNYAANGFFFVNYTNRAGDTIIARYQVSQDPQVADAGSEAVILTIDQPAANHNGGMLLFGPDGALYIGMGDGGAANDRFGNGQNPRTLLGKMLRLSVDDGTPYAIPGDNPYLNDATVAGEIWAVGLRNPWRYSFDRATGDLWIADVGQNAYEEINRVPAGQAALNYGWPRMEGRHCFQEANCQTEGLVMPVAEYDHSLGCSVTGGYVYRGSGYPVLQGAYLFADFCSGRVWGLPADAPAPTTPTQLLDTAASISSFGEDQAGELYLTDMGQGVLFQVTAE